MESDTWLKVAWALAIGAMLVFLLPRAKHMLKNSPKAGQGDWAAVVIPLALVILLVLLLIMAV